MMVWGCGGRGAGGGGGGCGCVCVCATNDPMWGFKAEPTELARRLLAVP